MDADHDGKQDPRILSFQAVRRALGSLGIALPVLLWFYSLGSGRWPPSISEYYYTPMGDVLVGILMAVGVFLISYLGYTADKGDVLSDRALSTTAGIGACMVALFPVKPGNCSLLVLPVPPSLETGFTFHPNLLHFGAAVTFLVATALISIFQFTKGERDDAGRLNWSPRCWTYLFCGTFILASIVALVPYIIAKQGADCVTVARMDNVSYMFWCEAIAVLAFAFSWLTKGDADAAVGDLARRARDHLTGATPTSGAG